MARLFRPALVMLSAAACAPPGRAPAPAPAPAGPHVRAADPDATPAPRLYASLCAMCHGKDATGYAADGAPSLVNRTFLESASDDQVRRGILDGRPGTSMAAYGVVHGGPLTAASAARIVAWLRTTHGPPHPLPSPGVGDPARGGALYATHCASCHGDAQTRGPAVQLANPRFLEEASDAFLAWAISHGRPGTKMESWQGRLTPDEIAGVIAFIRTFAHAAPEAALPPPTGDEPLVTHPDGPSPVFQLREERFVSIDQVKRALDEGRKLVVIDARPTSDWMHAHLPGAVSIPYYDLKRLDEVPADGTWVVAYCACPHHLSGEVVDALRKRGVRHAVVLDEGVLEWQRRGYPVVAAPGYPTP